MRKPAKRIGVQLKGTVWRILLIAGSIVGIIPVWICTDVQMESWGLIGPKISEVKKLRKAA